MHSVILIEVSYHTCTTHGSSGAMYFYKCDKVFLLVRQGDSTKYDGLLPDCIYKYYQGKEFGKIFWIFRDKYDIAHQVSILWWHPQKNLLLLFQHQWNFFGAHVWVNIFEQFSDNFLDISERKKNNPQNSGHYVPLQRPRAAHALRSDQCSCF